MPDWKEKLVDELMAEGKSKSHAWAIATIVEKRKAKKKAKKKRKK